MRGDMFLLGRWRPYTAADGDAEERPRTAATETDGKGCLGGGEIRREGGIDFITASEGAIDYTYAIDLGFDALDAIGLTVDVLLKDVTNTFAVDVETRKELLTATEWRTVVDGDTADHDVDALAMKIFKTDTNTLDKLVTSDLEVVLIVGIVDNTLDVAFVVARLQL